MVVHRLLQDQKFANGTIKLSLYPLKGNSKRHATLSTTWKKKAQQFGNRRKLQLTLKLSSFRILGAAKVFRAPIPYMSKTYSYIPISPY
jgi:hypothetical protein